MSTEANKDLVRRQIEAVFNRGDAAAIPGFWGSDLQEWAASTSQMLRTAFPDFHIAVERLVAEGDTVVAQMRWTGTHRGAFLSFPVTGKPFEITAIRVYRIAWARSWSRRQCRTAWACCSSLASFPCLNRASADDACW